jgi:hypothetical protein
MRLRRPQQCNVTNNNLSADLVLFGQCRSTLRDLAVRQILQDSVPAFGWCQSKDLLSCEKSQTAAMPPLSHFSIAKVPRSIKPDFIHYRNGLSIF